MPTYTPKAGDTTRSWYVIDATDVVLGRLAVAAANLLRGKHKPTFTPNVDGGDFVIVINADKVAISGDKLQNKYAYRHSGYPGGLRKRTIGELMEKHPDRVVEQAIVGMIPHTKLGQSADLVLVAPATARVIAAYRAGLSTDLLTNVLLATRAPVMICPASGGTPVGTSTSSDWSLRHFTRCSAEALGGSSAQASSRSSPGVPSSS